MFDLIRVGQVWGTYEPYVRTLLPRLRESLFSKLEQIIRFPFYY